MSKINEKREYFVKKWVKELSKKLQKPEEDLLLEGLTANDFGSKNVYIEHEDGSHSFYKYAFYVENEEEYAIFTEHCDYQELRKDWLNDIQEEESVNIGRLTRIKWIGDGNAYIEADNERLYLNKLQLQSLKEELNWFISYYADDFSPKNLRMLQNLSGKDNFHDSEE